LKIKGGFIYMIGLTNITKTYVDGNRKVEIFSSTDLQISQGELVAVKGRSGSGKSTLLRILAGLDWDYDGSYQFMGRTLVKNLTALADFRLKNIGIITQNYQLLPDKNCYENIALTLKGLHKNSTLIREKVEAIMKLLELSQYRNAYPIQLSGGQRQKIAIARAVVKSPTIFIADEPTGALDVQAEQEVLNSLRLALPNDCTMIIATHSDTVAQWCNRRIVIENQKLLDVIN